ncbi:type II secretion system F family protein [Enemella sp. A6]|uniref:type II secretion system F family protein n=1 Tax=Enemella sp. A6 TaxID=3440152 RepID=UPI003EC016FB
MIALWAAAGAAVVLGVWLIIAGLQSTTRPATSRFATKKLRIPMPSWRVGLAALGGVILVALTGWVVWLPIVVVAVVLGPRLLSAPPNRDIEVMQALDRWVRTLAATMATGRSVVDAIRAGRRSAPAQIAEPVNRLVARLNDRWTPRDALAAFADDLDSPDADAIAAALILAAQRGQTGAATTLIELSDSVQHRLRAWRDIEAERAKPRFVVRQVSVVMAVVLGASILIGGDFFSPYRTATGQVILLTLVLGYLGSLLMLRRMTMPPRRDRVLTVQALPGEGTP